MIFYRALTISITLFLIEISAFPQCNSKVTSFSQGELLTYQAYYNWGFIWIHAGDLRFSVDQKNYDNKKVYQFEADGMTIPSYDWAYKVRDKYESLVDIETFTPLFFDQNTNEDGVKVSQSYLFSNINQKVYINHETSKKTCQEGFCQPS